MVQALVAREGFARVASIATELVGARVEVLVPRPGSDGTGGTANERFVADLVGGGLPPWPSAVTEVVPIVVDDQVQGAVVASGELTGDAEAHLQSAARAALTGIAILDTRAEARRDSASGLIADLLSGRNLRSSDIAERARDLGCDLSGSFLALAVSGQGERGPVEIVSAIKLAHAEAIAEPLDGAVVALISGPDIEAASLDANLGGDIPRAHSSTYDDPGHALRALDEALTLLALLDGSAVPNTDRQTWDSLRILHGAYVNDPARLVDFCERTIGELIRRDEDEERRLQITFWTYQEANCNMNETADRLDAHRHTVANRLRRIRQLTGLDPQRGYDRELLGLAFRTHLVIENSTWR
jgi:PucR C-terminal helix-turn-helix domain/GGDEF-like domain